MSAPASDMVGDAVTSEQAVQIREQLSQMTAPDESTGYSQVTYAISLLGQLKQMGDASAREEFERLRALADAGENVQAIEGMADYYAFNEDTQDVQRFLKVFEYGSVLLRKGHLYNVYRMLPMIFFDLPQFGLDDALTFTGRVLQLCTDVQVLLDGHQIPETFEVESGGCCYSTTDTVKNDQHFHFVSQVFEQFTRAFHCEFLQQVEARFQDDRKPFRDLMLAMQYATSESESVVSESNLDKAWPFLLAACKAGIPYALTEFAKPCWRTRAVHALANATC